MAMTMELDEARLARAAAALIEEASTLRREIGMGPVTTSVGGISAGNYRLLRAAIRAALPEMFDGTTWLAPWEPTAAMRAEARKAMGHIVPVSIYAAMRDAHLSPETDAKVEG